MRYIIWLLLILLIYFRYLSVLPDYTEGDKIRITARVSSEPVLYETAQYLKLKGLKMYLPKIPEIHYGDKVVVEGVVEGDKLKKPVLIEFKQSESFLYKTRNNLVEFYKKALPQPHSSLIAGVTLGSKAAIPEDFFEHLRRTGTLHVVVASGMNVTLVAGFLMSFLIMIIPRRKAVILALVGVWTYAVLSGFDAPIVRAAIMGSIAFSAQVLGRLNQAVRALLISAYLMLLVNPSWITDLGFILSFAATTSLMVFEKRVRKYIMWVPSLFREGLSTSLSAQILIAPILFATFGEISLISPLVNAAVLWTIAGITIIGMIAGIIGLVSFSLGKMILLLSYPLTSWFIGVVELFS